MIFGRKNKQGEPQSNDMDLLNSVLLVVDGSDPSIAAAEFAVKLAKQVGSEITANGVFFDFAEGIVAQDTAFSIALGFG